MGAMLVALAAIGLPKSAATANSSYELEQGGHYRVCHAYSENLRLQTGFPGANGWPIDPRLKLFRKPKWEPLDPTPNFDRIMRVAQRAWTGRRQRSESEINSWRGPVEEAYRRAILEGKLELQIAKWDIDNYGSDNLLIRVTYRDPANHLYVPLIDIAEPSDELFEPFARNATGSPLIGDVFSYDGRKFVVGGSRMFIDIHETGLGSIGGSMVFFPICRYKES